MSSRWHDDSLWANSLRSLGGLAVPFDFAIFLNAADDVRSGESPYVDPETVSKNTPAPYVYPPLLAIVLIPATALPDEIGGSSPVGVLVSLLLIACVVAVLLVLEVRDWRCYRLRSSTPRRSRTSNTAPSDRCSRCSWRSRGGIATGWSPCRPLSGVRSC